MPFELSSDYLKFLLNDYAVPFAIRLLLAIAVFVIGKMVARAIVRAVEKVTRNRLEESLRRFLSSVLYGLLLAVVIIAALDRLGVKTTAAVAILGAAGLAIGLAFQASLGNFASGVMLIIFRPYKVGDVVALAGHIGTVQVIEVFTTSLLTGDNRRIIIPNGQITSGTIENLSAEPIRRIDMVFGISYDDDIKKARDILERIVRADERVLADPAEVIAVGELADSSVNFFVRPWVKTNDYWAVKWDLTEKVKQTFADSGITIPFPQRDVHLHQ